MKRLSTDRLMATIERWTGLPVTEDGARLAAAATFRRHLDDLRHRLDGAASREAARQQRYQTVEELFAALPMCEAGERNEADDE